jgi:hypothetical protein
LQRTEWNVRDTSGTIIFSLGPVLTGGSKKTVEFVVKHNKPCLHAHSGQEDVAQALRDFVADNEILTLNVAGPRESKEPGVAEFVREVLRLQDWRTHCGDPLLGRSTLINHPIEGCCKILNGLGYLHGFGLSRCKGAAGILLAHKLLPLRTGQFAATREENAGS